MGGLLFIGCPRVSQFSSPPFEVIHDVLAVLQHLKCAVHIDLGESPLDEENIILVIIHDKNCALPMHILGHPF